MQQNAAAAVRVEGLAHRFGERQALAGVNFSVEPREIFGLLGPNGGGKTTLFRILSTLLPVQAGSVQALGLDVQAHPAAVRSRIGVTFQSPSLDRKLTVYENLKHQGHLYGLAGRELKARIEKLLAQFGLTDRRSHKAESLSGGLQRRVEIAKGLLHDPQLLLLDEPSTGLDPGARHDLWQHLQQLRADAGVTVLVTTHLMEEAERCDRLAILDRGQIVGLGSPDELRRSVGGDCITLHSPNPAELARKIGERFHITPQPLGGALRIERTRGHDLLREVMEAFPDDVTSAALGRPTLEDVFIQRTGHQFWEGETQA